MAARHMEDTLTAVCTALNQQSSSATVNTLQRHKHNTVGIRTVNRKQLFAGQLIADNYSQDICSQRHVFAVTVVRHTINRPDNLRCQSGHYCLKKRIKT